MDSAHLFAGIRGGGIYHSDNHGAGWAVVHNGLTNTSVYTLTARGSKFFAGPAVEGVLLITD